jgi:L,D-transpeptidase YcbB
MAGKYGLKNPDQLEVNLNSSCQRKKLINQTLKFYKIIKSITKLKIQLIRNFLLLLFISISAFASAGGDLSHSIRLFIGDKTIDSRYKIQAEYLYSGDLLNRFYLGRMFEPAWFDNNTLSQNGYDLLDYIRQIDKHGLEPLDYHLTQIEKFVEQAQSFTPSSTEEMMHLDIMLTDAFIILGSQLHYGKVDPSKQGANWKMERKEAELRIDQKLEQALRYNNISLTLDSLAPRYSSYWMMHKELDFFLGLNKQVWPEILILETIHPGDSGIVLPMIRQRMILLRYPLTDSISLNYDEAFVNQIKLLQADWGLNADGVIASGTIAALNIDPGKLVEQLKVNMERLRWLPLQLTEKYIIVNIANQRLDFIDRADTLLSMRAIVGTNYRKTPVFGAEMTYLVFSPTWTVPPTILRVDVIPQLLKDSGYLKRKDMILLRFDGSQIAYSDIDWSKISANNFPYMVQQNPGSQNSLGRVKFMFPNSYNVYIHDTPSKGIFAKEDRAFSSGCIRVAAPFELAVLLLSDVPEWTPERIRNAMLRNKAQNVRLKTPVDVVVFYLTAWTDGNGRVQFRKDIYNRDELLIRALNEKPESISGLNYPF